MKRLAVLGQPISHSRSPAMQNAALAALGLAGEWHYEAIEVGVDEFRSRVAAMPAEGFVGANVTIPHKRAALAIADHASAAAREIGAANTLSFLADGIHADNTDAPGLIAALPGDPAGMRALVLGAGGAARAAIWALRGAGAEVTIWNRTASRAVSLAAEFGVIALGEGAQPDPTSCEILVNATAVGLASGADLSIRQGATFKALGFTVDHLTNKLVVVDLAYGADETELIGTARNRGAATVDGLEILVRQGAASLVIWTGLEPPLGTMRRAVNLNFHEPRSQSPRTPPPGSRPRGRR
ncbi:MAG: shikimate dehydrogenase [Solirubrobacterales bacterium]